jgi:hypothetical protein
MALLQRVVSRVDILKQAEKLMDELSSSKALLEIQYENEVSISLKCLHNWFLTWSLLLGWHWSWSYSGVLCIDLKRNSAARFGYMAWGASPTSRSKM